MFIGCGSHAVCKDLDSLPCRDGYERIYALICDGVVVYIGRSINIRARVKGYDHKEKEFDSVAHAKCNSGDVEAIEADNIVKFNPKLNKLMPVNNKYVSAKEAGELIIKSLKGKSSFAPVNSDHFYFERVFIGDLISKINKRKRDNK